MERLKFGYSEYILRSNIFPPFPPLILYEILAAWRRSDCIGLRNVVNYETMWEANQCARNVGLLWEIL